MMQSLARRCRRITLAACILCAALAQTADPAAQEKLAKHAKLFSRFDFRGVEAEARRAENMKPDAQGIIDLSPVIIDDYVQLVPPPSPREELQLHARLSDAVVRGTAERRYSALTPGHNFVYSDWVVKVTEIFKSSPSIPFQVGDEITVARTGGDLSFNGQHVVARDMTFPDFLADKEYVLYLVADVESASFLASEEGSMDVSGPSPVFLLNPKDNVTNYRPFYSMPTADFLTEVERSIVE